MIHYSEIEGIYKRDIDDSFIEKVIGDIMLQKADWYNTESNKSEIVTGRNGLLSWFHLRRVGEITKIINEYKLELNVCGLNSDIEEFSRFSKFDPEEQTVLFNMKNTAIKFNLITKKMEDIGYSKDNMFLSKLQVDYDPDFDNSLWLKSIRQIIPNEKQRKILQRWVAYSLINKYFKWQVSILLYGPRANNGKNTVMNSIGSLFSFPKTTTLERISNKFGLYQLRNSDFIIADESDAYFNNTSNFKNLITGEKMTIEGKGLSEQEALIDAKLIIAANKLSPAIVSDKGTMRRIIVLLTPESFANSDVRDPYLEEKLISQNTGIFNWALEELPNLINNVKSYQEGVAERTKKIFEDNQNIFANFMVSYCLENGDCKLDELSYWYDQYCDKYQGVSLNRVKIGMLIKEMYSPDRVSKSGVKSDMDHTKSTTLYTGISLNKHKLLNEFPNYVEIKNQLDFFGDDEENHIKLLRWVIEELEVQKEGIIYTSIYDQGKKFGMRKEECKEWLNKWVSDGLLIKNAGVVKIGKI
ncbi:MAG: DUF5906 domain-containing protein [Cocleimonas sp.]